MKNILRNSNFGFTKWCVGMALLRSEPRKLTRSFGGLRATRNALLATVLVFGTAVTGWGQLTLPSGTSYTETFDSIGTGLPSGWTGRTGASSSARGTAQTFTNTATSWSDSGGRFKNFASADGGTTADEVGRTDRAFGIRQTGSFGNAGASFELEIADTLGRADFNIELKHQMLSVQGRSTTWTVQYSLNGTAWTAVGTYTDPGTFGSTTANYSLGAALDNKSGPIYIRIVALSAASGSGSRDSYGIDDFSLSWSGGGGGGGTPPTITEISPAFGLAGTIVTITGTDFTGATAVRFN